MLFMLLVVFLSFHSIQFKRKTFESLEVTEHRWKENCVFIFKTERESEEESQNFHKTLHIFYIIQHYVCFAS